MTLHFELSNEHHIYDLAPEQGSEAISPHIADDRYNRNS